MIKWTVTLLAVVSMLLAQAQPPRLIVRGDDMGFSHSGNEALIKTCKEGIVTSVEILVPSPWFPEAVRLLQQNPVIDVGIHLALSSEWDNVKWRPLTHAPSLTDADGYFWPMIYPNKNYPGQALTENAWVLAEIEKEFRAQITTALKHLPQTSHISSHMGCVESSPQVVALTRRLAKEFQIDIDLTEHRVLPAYFPGPKKTVAEKQKAFTDMLGKLESGKTYLFVEHPGFDNAELRAIHHIGYEDVATDRQGVTDLFCMPAIKQAIRERGIQLISYRQLLKK